MKKQILFIFLAIFTLRSLSQTEIKGTIKDEASGETIVGATVMYATGKGTVTDLDGNFSLKIDSAGQYTLSVSYVGYETQSIKIKAANKPLSFNFNLKNQTLNEVEVVADVAKTRETPIAFANISSKQIQEELGTRDLPMLLNSTPGVYATQQGGGSGDARVNVRGFDQRNVAVMVDGVPVNDMENGAVYWSNWDGLGDITRTMQVQRGLGASKLAIPSVGGTINIITKGIDQKMSANIKQEVNDYGLYKTSFGFNTGQLKGGWGFTIAGSRKWGNEWADGTYTDAWSYFGKVQKRFKKHLFSISASGAPQSHGQRYDRLPVAVYSKKLSDKLGINTDSVFKAIGANSGATRYTTYTQGERGLEYNPNWGTIEGDGGTSDGVIGFFPKSKHGNVFNERVNFFHKPQFNLSHFWTPNDRLTVSTVLYLSVGHGGGTALKTTSGVNRDSLTGQWDPQKNYDDNRKASPATFYDPTGHPSNNYLRAANNDHFWYGVISSWNYKVNKNLSTLFGIDARSYKGTHYQSIYNLMGGDYAIDASDKNQPVGTGNGSYYVKHVGDKVSYYNDAKVYWGGLFAQAEYKIKKWTMFITGSLSQTGFQRIDYFKKKDLVIDGYTFDQAIGYGETFYFNGDEHLIANSSSVVTTSGDTTFIKNGPSTKTIVNAQKYTIDSKEARFSKTKDKWYTGYTIKGGANYNINDRHNVFINLGYLNMAPLMNTVFDNNNHEYLNIKNQFVYAIEGGYGFKHPKFAANVNLYYTIWKNKPMSSSAVGTSGVVYYNIIGLNTLNKGIEIDFTYKVLKNLDLEGTISLGDWIYTSSSKADIIDEDGKIIDNIDFSAKNVHIGDAAQNQYVASVRYTIIKGLYFKPRITYFGKNYSNFSAIDLENENRDRESWRLPDYALCDAFVGYDFNYWKLKFGLSAGVLNVFNTTYISDAQNNGSLNHKYFDATSATVYMGMGRRFNVALRIGF